ncbi:hypothetical protein [Streptomyces sp. NPDC005476]|uniref:hypothetical protein n=1 Tax=Streptomyces sp. NPDC005476 TaxID=3156882 RepID=UPI0034528396
MEPKKKTAARKSAQDAGQEGGHGPGEEDARREEDGGTQTAQRLTHPQHSAAGKMGQGSRFVFPPSRDGSPPLAAGPARE